VYSQKGKTSLGGRRCRVRQTAGMN
jgi:hypothetical protein